MKLVHLIFDDRIQGKSYRFDLDSLLVVFEVDRETV